MHEFAIAEALVKAVAAEMKQADVPAGGLAQAVVVIGALQQVVPENLRQAYRILIENTPARGSTLKIEAVPVRAACPRCGWRGEIDGGLYLCPKCNARDVNVIAGRELYLTSLEVNDRDNFDQSVSQSG